MDNSQTLNNKFGYAEMYEWAGLPGQFGRLVQFSQQKNTQHKIEYATDEDEIIGVSSINAAFISDNPQEWFLKYYFNEFGDIYVNKKDIAVGHKVYDNLNEFKFIKTEKQTIYEPVLSPEFDESKQYFDRTSRREWTRVTILGKCIVEDNGQCKAGDYCKLYNGTDESLYGTVIPCSKNDPSPHWRVLNRVSQKTIFIFYK